MPALLNVPEIEGMHRRRRWRDGLARGWGVRDSINLHQNPFFEDIPPLEFMFVRYKF